MSTKRCFKTVIIAILVLRIKSKCDIIKVSKERNLEYD